MTTHQRSRVKRVWIASVYERAVWVLVLMFSILSLLIGVFCMYLTRNLGAVSVFPALMFTGIGVFGLVGSYNDYQRMTE